MAFIAALSHRVGVIVFWLFSAGASILVAPVHAEILWVGQRGRIDDGWHRAEGKYGGWWACRSYDDFQKFERLRKEDIEAAFKVAERSCVKLRDGTEIVVEDATFFHFALCVRPRSEADCLWIDQLWISKAP
jgi:hypothetical protein